MGISRWMEIFIAFFPVRKRELIVQPEIIKY